MLTRQPLVVVAMVVAGSGDLAAQIVQNPAEVFHSAVHAFSPRLQALNPAFLGHLPDPVSDAARNPAMLAEHRTMALVADGRVGAWGLHALGGSPSLGWSLALVAGPEQRADLTNLSQVFGFTASATPPPATVPDPVLVTLATRFEARAGLSARARGGDRFGMAMLLGTQPHTGTVELPGPSRRLDGEGWGAVVGWTNGRRDAGRADLVVGMSDGTVNAVAVDLISFTTKVVRDRHRERWARLVLAPAGLPDVSLVAAARRATHDLRLDQAFQGAAPIDTSAASTTLDASGARRWHGAGWSALLLVGLAYEHGSGKLTAIVQTALPPPPTVTRVSAMNQWAPYVGTAGEVEVVAGFRLRGSVVARAMRARSTADTTQIIGGSSQNPAAVYQALTEVRLGFGYGPPGGPFVFDAFVPDLTAPRRWVVSAAYRF
jgi:hypothetical protein